MNRYLLVILIMVVSACSAVDERPNFLFMFSDDHTTQAVSAYGDGRIETPNLDNLASEGILFENCFCTNSICAPSRAVVLTGKYSHINGLQDNSQVFNGSQQTFPKLLQEAGYRTAMIGKWHLKSEPTGFDFWSVLPGQGEYFNPDFKEMGKLIKKEGYVTEIITEEAILFLKTYNYDKPFCLMVQHKAPHANWEWPEKYQDEFTADFPIPETFHDDYKSRTKALSHSILKVDSFQWNYHYKYRFGEYPYDSPEEMYQRYMHDYMRCIRAVDNSVGEILLALEECGLDDNTVVIYSSDQGFFLGEHGLYDKRFMYEESLRMPLIVKGIRQKAESKSRGKGISGNDLRNTNIVLNLDFGPTILDLAGVEVPLDMQGRSFAPLIYGEDITDWRKSMYYHLYEQAYYIGEHEGVRTDQYKLIHFSYPEDGWELFDLKTDPSEMNNLAAVPEYENIRIKLENELDSLKTVYKLPVNY